MEERLAPHGPNERYFSTRRGRGEDQGLFAIDGTVIALHHLLGTSAFSPLVEIAGQTPEGMMQHPSKYTMWVGRIGIIVHPTPQDEVDSRDHVPRFNGRLAGQARHFMPNALLSSVGNEEARDL
jgi:hypothetical protein